jgi:hypothetical protein
MKTIEKLFGASVAVVSLTTLITTVTGLIGFALPRWAIWVIGIVNLISLPLLIYSTVMSLREKARTAKKLEKKAAGRTPVKAAAAQEEKVVPVAVKVRPKPNAQQLAAKRAASGNKPKKGKKKK